MELPIIYKLKRESQKELAELQDEAIEVVYSLLQNAVIHGGTAIWRCYGGKRFSEDIDLYADYKEDFKVLLENELKKRGLILFKFRQTESTLFSQISDNNAKMSLEITRKNVKGTLKAYQKVNGNQIDVLTLRPEELLLEKMAAYNDRLKVRDIYDVYFLSRFVNDRNVKDSVKTYLSKIKKPVDENDLKAIIYEGKVPTFEEMLEVLNAWAR
ncbi:MAG: nucleotidyl transferase AbiEii/AbiGii toxin family protein [Candidatus Parvarchaeota archaeon]|jgi:predicted nucleotidyltransferase component of viral defense system|nr:nucleotidyl transferase AbiEii/AbiGii toxin family protein [Candidatus Parvarchaeum tengchongense]MCW1299553.1 nucleotidyl transferase AbiEii/AbiGii toxin family protein [Candidatus Parvarchaeum tengchongense]MCW1312373.1 nucleotidyl transferase AbiEii/AbiGii toxin family protein [Candidatus Parvarchaeum tengchongense]